MHVHILHQPEAQARQRLEIGLHPSIQVSYGGVEHSAPFEVLVAGRPSRRELEASQVLATLVIPFAGLPKVTEELLLQRPSLQVLNLHHNAAPTAEMAVTLMLAAMKRILPADQDLRRGDWSMRYQPRTSRMAAGGEAVILGFGAVGQEVATRCQALGMQVTAISRSGEPSGRSDMRVLPVKALDEALRTCAALLICLPLTEETRGLIDAQRLRLLPEDAVLINVGRGDVVEEEALYNLLNDGRILGAGLDVWYHYPASEEERTHTRPSRCPFHELDNVVMSPHMAGGVQDMELRRMEGLAALLNHLANGVVPAENVVDVRRGY